MYDNLELSDVRSIIDKLMLFIVLDGKSFVDENDKKKYVHQYLNLLVNIVNDPVKLPSSSKSIIMEYIIKDISEYID